MQEHPKLREARIRAKLGQQLVDAMEADGSGYTSAFRISYDEHGEPNITPGIPFAPPDPDQ